MSVDDKKSGSSGRFPVSPSAHEPTEIAQPTPTEIRKNNTAVLGRELTGHKIKNVKLEEIIGVGGSGVVFRGVHELLQENRAVKILRPEYVGREEILARFIQDAKVTRILEHPGILQALDAGIDHSTSRPIAYIISPFVDNAYDLSQAPLPAKLAAHAGLEAAKILDYAHSKNIIHRDMKPGNILVQRKKEGVKVYVIDWGIAKVPANAEAKKGEIDNMPGFTLQKTLMGTPQFIAPEQAADASTATPLADVYSLACALYGMHSDTAPYEDRTTAIRRKETPSDVEMLATRSNVNKLYRVWLNDEIELKRRELAGKTKKEAGGLDRLVKLDEDYEDLIMMVLNAKNPDYRLSMGLFIERLTWLIKDDKIIYQEKTAEEKAAIEEHALKLVQKSETLASRLSGLKLDSVESQDAWFETKLEYAKTLEGVAHFTSRDDDRRLEYTSKAFDEFNQLEMASRRLQVQINSVNIDSRIQWLKALNHHEQARKKYRETRQAEHTSMIAYDFVREALEKKDYSSVVEHYKKVDASKLPDELKPAVEGLGKEIESTVSSIVDDGDRSIAGSDLNGALEACANADLLAKVLPDTAEVKKRVGVFYTQVQALELRQYSKQYQDASRQGDFVKMYQCADAMKNKLGSMPAELRGSLEKAVNEYLAELEPNKGAIQIFETVSGAFEALEAKFKSDEKELGDFGFDAEKISKYKTELEESLGHLGAVKEEKVGVQYASLKSRMERVQGRLEMKEAMIGLGQGDIVDQIANASMLLKKYAQKGDENSKNMFLRILYDKVKGEYDNAFKPRGDTK